MWEIATPLWSVSFGILCGESGLTKIRCKLHNVMATETTVRTIPVIELGLGNCRSMLLKESTPLLNGQRGCVRFAILKVRRARYLSSASIDGYQYLNFKAARIVQPVIPSSGLKVDGCIYLSVVTLPKYSSTISTPEFLP